jgi:putative transposase
MPDYRRNFTPGGTYFFTVVTHERRPILTTEIARSILRRAISEEKEKRPLELVASVLLPDHIHAIWTLPINDFDFSARWARFKSHFSREYLQAGGQEGMSTSSRERHSERAV